MINAPDELIRLLARLAVEDYLQEVSPTSPPGDEADQPEAPSGAT